MARGALRTKLKMACATVLSAELLNCKDVTTAMGTVAHAEVNDTPLCASVGVSSRGNNCPSDWGDQGVAGWRGDGVLAQRGRIRDMLVMLDISVIFAKISMITYERHKWQ